jgi:hypothetical protein
LAYRKQLNCPITRFFAKCLVLYANWSKNCGSALAQGSIRYSPDKSTQRRAVLGQKLSKAMELLHLREVSGIRKAKARSMHIFGSKTI